MTRRERTELPELRFVRLVGSEPSQDDLSVLDRHERRRAAALTRSADRAAYVTAHAALRRLLGARLGRSPEEIPLVREPCPHCGAPRGRPAVGDSSSTLHFSLSRSGRWALLAIAPAPVGVDIEALPDLETVAEVSAALHPDDRAEILAAPASARADVFARAWTRTEAYLKGVGVGLAHDHLGSRTPFPGLPGWSVFDVSAPRGYAAAAAVHGRSHARGSPGGYDGQRQSGWTPFGGASGHAFFDQPNPTTAGRIWPLKRRYAHV